MITPGRRDPWWVTLAESDLSFVTLAESDLHCLTIQPPNPRWSQPAAVTHGGTYYIQSSSANKLSKVFEDFFVLGEDQLAK